jgi:Cas7 group CRISPR-associated protein Csh2
MFDDGRGLISPVSFKRKIRDLVETKGAVYTAALTVLGTGRGTEILESRGRERKVISEMNLEDFREKYWDARIFGNTFVEKADKGKFITTGVVQVGTGVSLAPMEIMRLTLTNKAGVEGDKDRGMAPLAFRVVRHALYVMPFFVNPSAAAKSGCDAADIDLLKFIIPHTYAHTASAIRPQVEIVHAFYAEHKSPLGSCPDPLLIAALTPKRKEPEKVNEPSLSIDEYNVPDGLPGHLLERLASFQDLCLKDWATPKAA